MSARSKITSNWTYRSEQKVVCCDNGGFGVCHGSGELGGRSIDLVEVVTSDSDKSALHKVMSTKARTITPPENLPRQDPEGMLSL